MSMAQDIVRKIDLGAKGSLGRQRMHRMMLKMLRDNGYIQFNLKDKSWEEA
jgi:hypothetical protein